MAKLSVELDTATNEISVSVDGVKIENAAYVSVSNYNCYYDPSGVGPSYHFSVETRETVGDVVKSTSLCASERGSAKASENYPGLFEMTTDSGVKTLAGFEIAQAFMKGHKVKS